MEEAVDAAEIDERTVLGDVLDRAGDDLVLLKVLEGGFLETVALLLEKHTTREHDVAALLVELDDLELEGLTEEAVEVADRPEIDLRPWQERFDASADGHCEAALHPLGDRALDELVALARGADLVPDLELVGLLLGEHDEAVLVLLGFDQDVDGITGGRRDIAFGIDELVKRDDSFGFVSDVDDDGVFADFQDRPGDDVALAELVCTCCRGFEKSSEALGIGGFDLCGFGHL